MTKRAIVLCIPFLLAACDRAAPAPAAPTPPTTRATKVDAPGAAEVRYFVLDKSCPYCRDLQRMIEGGGKDAPAEPPLAKVYEGRIRFVFRPAFNENWDPNPEAKAFDFGGAAHGFAGIAADGAVKFVLPGHHVTRPELVAAIDDMLR